jgi:tetratricopeptide (TPR) repeat protein
MKRTVVRRLSGALTGIFFLLPWLLPALPANADRVAELRRLTRSRNELEACQAAAELAGLLRREGNMAAALRITRERGGMTASNLVWPFCLIFVENARCQYEAGEQEMAVSLLKYAERRTDGLPAVLVLEALGDCLLAAAQPEGAADYYRQALELGRKTFPPSENTSQRQPDPREVAWQAVQVRIEAAQRQLLRRRLIEEVGLDYVLYKEAREHQLAGRLDTAWKLFNQLVAIAEGNMYGEAAAFYRGLCFSGEDAAVRRRRYFQAFIAEQPLGLYRGEALYAEAQAALQTQWDIGQAASEFTSLIDWCERAGNGQTAVRLVSVPERSRALTLPPADNQRTLDWGIIEEVVMPPDKLVNRQTASWYLDDLAKRACLGLAFCRMAAGKWDEAAAVLERVPNLDPHIRRAQQEGRVNTYARLQRACQLRRLVADPRELEKVPAELRTQICYGDFLYLSRQWPRAVAVYRQALAASGKSRNRPGAAVALVSLAETVWNLERPAEARKAFAAVIERYPGTASAGRAAFCLANIGNGDPGLSRKDRFEQEVQLYEKAVQWGRNTWYEANAMAFNIIPLLELGRRDEAWLQARRLLEKHPDKGWERFVAARFKPEQAE